MLLIASSAFAQMKVTGVVTDLSDGAGIPYATIFVKGTSAATVADAKGAYSMNKVPANAVLVFSSIGYKTVEIPVEGKIVIDAVLSQEAVGLEEVMVVAYGVVKKGSYSGSATMVKGDAIKDIPAMTFEQAITGAVAGVSISQTSGQPGGMPEIRVRGLSSFNAGNDPLYVIDGIPATSGDLSSANIWSSTMNYLNPSDIETITILKDAAAASLYGSRAANGVILITTKKGNTGKIVSTFKASTGVSYFAYNNYPLANDSEAEMLHREAWTNYANANASSWSSYGSISAYVNAKVQQYYPAKKEGYKYVDWEDVLFRNAVSQNYEFSISGGGPQSKVYASVGYNDQQGVNVMENLTRISTTFNAEAQASKHIKVGGTFQFTSTNQKGNQDGAAKDNPYYLWKVILTSRWPYQDPEGNYWMESYNGSYRNPVPNYDKQIANSKQGRTLIKGYVEADLMKGLKAKSILSYDYTRIDDRFGWMMGHPNGTAYGNGYIGDRYRRVEKLVSSTTLNYEKTFAEKHHLTVMAGWEAEDDSQQYTNLSMSDFANYGMQSTYLAATLKEGGTYNDQSTLNSVLGNLNYDFDNRYFVTATLRRDGSSRLSPVERWGNFWSLSGSWKISNEKFMKDVEWADNLRLRASYGTSGTLPSDRYGYMSLFSYETYGDGNAAYPDNLASLDLTWEKNLNWNVAIEYDFLDRFGIIAEYYQRTTKDLLLDASVPSTTGFQTALRNVGSIQNKGVELSLRADIIKNKNMTWNFSVNWSKYNNEILELSEKGETIPNRPHIWTAGYSYYQYYTRKYLGADPATGDALYAKGTLLDDGSYDMTPVNRKQASSMILKGMTAIPKGFGGFNSNFSYKELSVSMAWSYKYGHYVWDNATDAIDSDGYSYRNNISADQLNRWTTAGDDTNVPARIADNAYGGYYDSSRYLKKGDYLRLKNLTISYDLTKVLKNKANARVYLAGANLLTFSGLNFDPEVRDSGYYNFSMPAMRTFSIGVELTLK